MTSKEDIYKSILYHAADIYGIEYDDIERDLAQQFDPLVRFMSGAMASELERVYHQIHDTDSRLQKRLAQVILPEKFHLPRPAHALAGAQLSSDAVQISERTELLLKAKEDAEAVAFSPVFSSQLLPVQLRWVATDATLRPAINKSRRTRQKKDSDFSSTRRIALGFSAPEPITNWKNVSLYFDLKQLGRKTADKDALFRTLEGVSCRMHGHQLTCFYGLPVQEHRLEDYLDGSESLEKTIRNRYERQFITFQEEEVAEIEPLKAEGFLASWFATTLSTDEEKNEELKKLGKGANKPLFWLEVHLPRPIESEQLSDRLQVQFNVFPVVNRRLNGHGKGEHHYLRENSIKWVDLQPREDFISIRRVYEDKAPDYPSFLFKPFAEFKEDRRPSYTLRHGGIGRWDDFNAWQRLSYLLNIMQDNYKQSEIVEQAAKALSLEDIHHLLGNKIAQTKEGQKPTRDIYVLLHTGISTGLRVRVEYWTSIGAAANGLPVKANMVCASKEKSDIDALALISAPEGGQNPLNSSQQLDAMKEVLLSRGRIVTREDVRVFCQNFLGEKQAGIDIADSVGIDPRFDFGMTRVLEVKIKPGKKTQKEDWEGICNQIQRLLDEKSTSSIPFKVTLNF